MEFLTSTQVLPYVASLVALLVYMTWAYLIALYQKNNGVADIAYGLGFIMVAFITWYNFSASPVALLVSLMVLVWGLRLSLRVYMRNHGKPEDFRYAKWRTEWQWVKVRSYLQVFLLQGGIIFLIALPIVALNTSAEGFSLFTFIGALVWLVGFFFEAVGDYQLSRFIKDPTHKGQLMTTGLWRYTRHPNYFGEATMWWGIWIMAIPALFALSPYLILVGFFVSPALITYLLLKVSGVPMLEAAMQGRPGWVEYAAKTSAFFPKPPHQ